MRSIELFVTLQVALLCLHGCFGDLQDNIVENSVPLILMEDMVNANDLDTDGNPGWTLDFFRSPFRNFLTRENDYLNKLLADGTKRAPLIPRLGKRMERIPNEDEDRMSSEYYTRLAREPFVPRLGRSGLAQQLKTMMSHLPSSKLVSRSRRSPLLIQQKVMDKPFSK